MTGSLGLVSVAKGKIKLLTVKTTDTLHGGWSIIYMMTAGHSDGVFNVLGKSVMHQARFVIHFLINEMPNVVGV
jgi:hypothetical protein